MTSRTAADGPPKKKARGAKASKGPSAKDDDQKRNSEPPANHRRPPPMLLGKPLSDLTPQQRCELIAELSESVLEDPTSAFSSARVQGGQGGGNGDGEQRRRSSSKMRRLMELADPRADGNDESTARLTMLSLLAVYQDVLPTYRIRLPTEAELSVRIKKETKKLWDYERSLLTHYQKYLQLLEQTWSDSKGLAAPTGLSVTAMLCLCELLKGAPHFNFRSNVLAAVVRQMNHRTCDEVSAACCAAVSHVFQSDAQGEVALEAARLVAKTVRDRNFAVRPEVLRTFVSLPLRVHEDEAQAAKIAAAAKAKKRKGDQEAAEIDAHLREGEATVDKIVLARAQADTLQAVTLTYFRILKSDNVIDGKAAELLPPALEGLAKFAHLINIDTVVDLLDVLKGMLKRVDALPLDAALNCILTAFQTLEGPGREMQIDQKEYVTPLYSQLPRLCTTSNCRHTGLALRCLTAAFLRHKEYSTTRIAAFAKRLCGVALHAPPEYSAPVLAFVRQLLARYPAAHRLLENEQDVVASGQYLPDADDPERANAFAAPAWELSTLRFHVHPAVAEQAGGAAAGKALRLPAEAPERILSGMVRDAAVCYIKQRASRRKHPLRVSGGEARRKRQNVRFITPRKTLNYHLK